MRWLLLCVILLVPSLAQAATFWTDTFEYANQGAFEAVWASSCPGTSSIMGPSTEYAVAPMSPTKSLRAVQNGGANSCFIDRSYSTTTSVFYRWFHRHSAGYDLESLCSPSGSCPGGNGAKVFYAKALGSNYQVYWFIKPGSHTIRANTLNGTYPRTCPNGQTDTECLYEQNMGSVPIQPSTTYCIETEIQRGTPGLPNGAVRVWVNNTLIIQYTNVPIASSSESGGFNNATYYSQSGYGTRYVDDVAVGNTRIGGCSGGGGPAPDTTPPSQPTNLQATANGANQISISFTGSTDNVGVTQYVVERCSGASCSNFTFLTNLTAPTVSYVNTGLTASTSYSYRVRATDAAGNLSPFSATASATTTATIPQTPGTDNFNRANSSDLGLAWDAGYTGRSPLAITSNQARPSAINASTLETYNGLTAANDQYAQITLSQVGGSGSRAYGLAVRFANAPTKTGYDCLAVLPSTATTSEWAADVNEAKTSVSFTWQPGDKLNCEMQGTTFIQFVIRGGVKTELARFTDASVVSGKPGVLMFQGTGTLGDTQFDDFEMGSFAASAPTLPAMATVAAEQTEAIVSWAQPPTPAPTTIRVAVENASVVEPLTSFVALTTRTTLDSDDFNRANNADLGAEWLSGHGAANAFTLTSNTIRVTATGNDSTETFTGTASPNNQWAQVTFSTVSTPGVPLRAPGVLLRWGDPGTLTGYACRAYSHTGGTRARIERWSPSAIVELVEETTITWASGDIMRFEAEGNTLRCYRNDVLILSASDSTYASGRVGLVNYIASGTTADVILDDFAMGGFTGTTNYRYTYPAAVLNGRTNFACFYPRDAGGTENTAGGICDSFPAVTPTGPITVGARENVMCAPELLISGCPTKPYSWPDQAIGVVKNGSLYNFFSSNDANYNRMQGTLTNPGATTFEGRVIGNMKATFQYKGGGPIYQVSPTEWLMFYHAEIQHETSHVPFFGMIGMARSTDAGVTFNDLGLIITHHSPIQTPRSAMTQTRNMGVGTFIIKTENSIPYFYVYFENSVGPLTQGYNWQNVSVARARVSDVLTAATAGNVTPFFKYCNGTQTAGTYNVVCPGGLWTELGLGGLSTRLHAPNDFLHQQSVIYNTTLGKYLMAAQCSGGCTGNTAVWPENAVGMIESADGLTWTNLQILWDDSALNWYPSFIGTGENPQFESGDSFYVYSVYEETGANGTSNSERILSRRLVTVSTTTGSPPNLSNPAPTSPLPAGTTSTTISVSLDKISQCRWNLTDVAYASMANQMTVNNLTASGTVGSLTNGSTTPVYVRCQFDDGNGNVFPNLASTTITLTVLSPTDVTAPVMSGVSPQGVQPSGTTSVILRVQTNENATCKYGTSDVAYASLPSTFTTTGGTAHAQTIGSLTDGTSHTYFFRCQDGIPNTNTVSVSSAFSIAPTPPVADTTPPVISGVSPSGVQPAGTTSVTVRFTTNEGADCRHSPTIGVAYSTMTDEMPSVFGTAHQQGVTGLVNGGNYTRYYKCIDAAGNAMVNDQVVAFSVTSSAPDVAPPVLTNGLPIGEQVLGTTEVVMSLTTSENATCKYGPLAGVAYAAQPSTMTGGGGTSHTATISSLVDSTAYARFVRCIDAALNPNLEDFLITWSIGGDVAPPVLSAGGPIGEQVLGTTSVNLIITSSENATCRYSATAGTAYAVMESGFSTTGTTSHSTSITGLTNGSSRTFYVRCQDAAGNPTLTDYIIPFTVAAPAADTTAPSTVSNLVATALSSSQIEYTWGQATDNVLVSGYNLMLCAGEGCSDYTLAAFVSGVLNTTFIVPNLVPFLSYSAVVRAVDSSNNLSAADSNIVTATTLVQPDVTAPSTMTGLLVCGQLQNTIRWCWDAGTDDRGAVTTSIERCQGAGCSTFTTVFSQIATEFENTGLTAGTTYCARGKHTDGANNVSAAYSETVCGTTTTSGLPQDRPPVPFGVERESATRDASGTRTPRP